ncbi:MAG TPA: YicC/YloC family endoribonuclease [Acidobacteriota bacterium]|nr:YicC/YloC family endoribonuclease [Acidobacteriota bacterium]
MYSMTGFGRAEIPGRLGRLTVEIATVNSRFLEFTVRLPKPYFSLEPRVREYLSEILSRGKVTVTVNLDEPEDATGKYAINDRAVRAYVRQLRQLHRELKLDGDINLSSLVSLPDVVQADRNAPDPERIWKTLRKGLHRAAGQLVEMRKREGRAMAADMNKRLKSMAGLLRRVERQTRDSVQVYADKLHERIESLLQRPVCDAARLEEEVALFADRTDIAEECVRLDSHLDQFAATLKAKSASGRRLNFILQEMNREVNTIGSKSADLGIAGAVISLKEEVEKLREMVQNVE